MGHVEALYESRDKDAKGAGGRNPRRASIGLEGVLQSKVGEGSLRLATDKQAMRALTKASGAREDYSFQELAVTGCIFSTPEGTRIRFIDQGFSIQRVRVLEGEHISNAGCVPYEWIQPL